jgi:hypothetical protein
MERPHKGQMKKDKGTNNDLQNITHKIKDRVTRTPLKPEWNHLLQKGSSGDNVINEERTRKCLRQVEPIRGHLWHRYSETLEQTMVPTVKRRSDNFNLTNRNPWFSSFLASSNPRSRKSWYDKPIKHCLIF